MKKILIFGAFVGLLSSCGGNAYLLSSYEKEAQKGFHANQAKKIIDKNEKNKAINKKAAEKSKKEQNEHLNALNKNKGKGGVSNDRTFKFY
jgi:hypothetical protein